MSAATIEAHQALCDANGHRSMFPKVESWDRDSHAAAQGYVFAHGWICVTNCAPGGKPRADGVPFRMLNWTKQRNSEVRWVDEDGPRGGSSFLPRKSSRVYVR